MKVKQKSNTTLVSMKEDEQGSFYEETAHMTRDLNCTTSFSREKAPQSSKTIAKWKSNKRKFKGKDIW